MKRICVFCGSKAGDDPAFLQSARRVGELLVEHRLTLIYGGGGRGMMGALADAVLGAGGEVVGVIPRGLFQREALHPGLQEVKAVDTMLERKAAMAELSDAFITLPGGIGTLDELFEMWTWSQLGIHRKPNGLLNVNGYYDPLLSLLDHVTARGFLSRNKRSLLFAEREPVALLARLAAFDDAAVG